MIKHVIINAVKFLRAEIFPALLIIILSSILIWKHIPSLQFVGEGFYYFGREPIALNFDLLLHHDHDLLAKILFNILPPIFQDKVYLYMWFLFLTMIFINSFLYIIVRVVIENELAAFLGAFILSISYVANYDMFSIGGYQYFVQRGILPLFFLPAFCLFILYFKNNFQLKYYAGGLTIYLIGILMGFFGTWFLPFFIFYPLFFLIFNIKKGWSIILKSFWAPIPFIVGNFLIIRSSSFIPQGESFTDFLLYHKGQYLGVLQQLSAMTIPVTGLNSMVKNFFERGDLIIQGNTLNPLIGLSVLILYLVALYITWKLNSRYIPLQLTSFSTVVAMLLLNVYLNSAATLTTYGSSRYFYFPYIFLALFWGIFLAVLISSLKKLAVILTLIFIVILSLYNYISIQRNLKVDEPIQNVNKTTIKILRSWAPDFKKTPSIVYIPLGPYGSEFASRFFGHSDGEFLVEGLEPIDLRALSKKGVSKENLYVLHYDSNSQRVVDKTNEYRALMSKLEKNE